MLLCFMYVVYKFLSAKLNSPLSAEPELSLNNFTGAAALVASMVARPMLVKCREGNTNLLELSLLKFSPLTYDFLATTLELTPLSSWLCGSHTQLGCFGLHNNLIFHLFIDLLLYSRNTEGL